MESEKQNLVQTSKFHLTSQFTLMEKEDNNYTEVETKFLASTRGDAEFEDMEDKDDEGVKTTGKVNMKLSESQRTTVESYVKKVTLIAAFESTTRGIGVGNIIPWSVPEDMSWFNIKTRYVPENLFVENPRIRNAVVYGSNTFAAMKNTCLPGRLNVVLTHAQEPSKALPVKGKEQPLFKNESLEDVIAELQNDPLVHEIFICGGEVVYRQALTLCTEAFITKIEYPPGAKIPEFDRFFPELELESLFAKVYSTIDPITSKDDIKVSFEYWLTSHYFE